MAKTDEVSGQLQYFVVINEEEQYSIWPEGLELPDGWQSVAAAMPKDKCLAYIDEVWTDMRPASLRRAMEAAEQGATHGQ
jgi:MbtH protein